MTQQKKKELEWKSQLYELSGGSDDYGNCMVDVEKIIPFIKALLSSTLEGLKVEKRSEVDYPRGIKDDALFYGRDEGYNQAVSEFNSRITDLQKGLK